jgi:hypothetical protein
MKKKDFGNAFAYLIVFAIGFLCSNYIKKCSQNDVYVEYEEDIFHKIPVCEAIPGFNKIVYEDDGIATGSEKISEDEVFDKPKYKMCSFCFSPMERKHREEYLYKLLDNNK